ncbi:MAG: DNA repair protein RecN [Cytophagales bacterium]|nr:DNA repair protein RecN [Cytophagales bacterium]
MIKGLLIKNYALIQNLQMDPSIHLSTITGETGAGKSIMLGALGLLLGNRADTKVLFLEDQKCIIEGIFDISAYNLNATFNHFELDYQDETIIRREISPSGKSRAFVNDTPVTLDIMKDIGKYLVDIHSQRDTYLLGASGYQLTMIDGYAQNQDLIRTYKAVFKKFKKQENEFFALKEQAEELSKEADYNHFLLEELDDANINAGELEHIEEELRIIEHAEEIKGKLFECLELLENSEYSVNSGLQQVIKNIAQISIYAAHFEPLRSRLESCFHELKDIAKELEDENHKVEFDKNRQEEIQERIGLIYQLLQKHHSKSESDLMDVRESLRAKVDKVQNMDEELAVAKKELDHLSGEMSSIGEKLSKSRTSVFDEFKIELEKLLKELAMPFASIEIMHEQVSPTENGLDRISVLFSANAGVAPDELKNAASGGEFSRLMFCIKYMLIGRTSLPTIIFDEIDTGISGEIALKMVKMMKEMAKRHQVIAITHLPQIAASGDRHYFVFKKSIEGKSVSKIKRLSESDRISEIAKMIGGDNPSEAALENARELLNSH